MPGWAQRSGLATGSGLWGGGTMSPRQGIGSQLGPLAPTVSSACLQQGWRASGDGGGLVPILYSCRLDLVAPATSAVTKGRGGQPTALLTAEGGHCPVLGAQPSYGVLRGSQCPAIHCPFLDGHREQDSAAVTPWQGRVGAVSLPGLSCITCKEALQEEMERGGVPEAGGAQLSSGEAGCSSAMAQGALPPWEPGWGRRGAADPGHCRRESQLRTRSLKHQGDRYLLPPFMCTAPSCVLTHVWMHPHAQACSRGLAHTHRSACSHAHSPPGSREKGWG